MNTRQSSGNPGLVGTIFVLAGILCAFFGERQVARAHAMVQAGTEAVIDIDPGQPVRKHQGQLVHFSGLVETEETLVDPLFAIRAGGLVLRREAEMYQWLEEEHRQTRTDASGHRRTRVTYSYDRAWAAYAVQSDRFHEPTGHENAGSMPFKSEAFVAESEGIGGIAIPRVLLEQIAYREPLSAAEATGPDLDLAREPGEDYLYYRHHPGITSVGDLRVGFSIVPETQVSVIARLQGDTVVPYQVAEGVDIFLITDNLVAAADMLDRARESATEYKWAYRILGFVLPLFGLVFVREPVESLAHRVPIIAAAKRSGFFFPVLLALILAGLALAFAWLFYDLAIGLAILLPAVALMAVCHVMGRRKPA